MYIVSFFISYKLGNRSTYILHVSIGRRVVVALSQFPQSGEVRPVVSRRRVADVIAVARAGQNTDGQASSVGVRAQLDFLV